MPSFGRNHPALLAGWVCFAFLFLIGFASAAASESPAQLLRQADSIKTSDNPGFVRILEQLKVSGASLSPAERVQLRYLTAWQSVYDGKYETAISELNAVIKDAGDPTLRFRAVVTVVNALAIATHYEEGYSRLDQMLELMPRVLDREAREQGLVVAAVLYNQAGQYDLAAKYADQLLEGNDGGRSACQGQQLRLEARYKSGKLRSHDREFQDGIDTCVKADELLYANYIRSFVASLQIAEDQPANAIALLQENYGDVQRSRYARVVSGFDALLAEAFFRVGDLTQAQLHGRRAVDGSVKNEFTNPLVDAYRVLYLVSQRQGDHQSALAFHEKFATADKGYLTEASTKALAYQTVRQQVQEKKQQIDALSKRNEVLQLEQKVSKSAAQTRGLYILLLLSVLAFIAMWLYITKRSQLHFMKLARRDGLTGIFNRAHFADAAEAILAYCKKGDREACVVLIDLDHFKLVNDEHGHAAGDAVLKRTVQACQAHLRSIDIIGRLGGEEFGIVLPDCNPEHAKELAEQFRLAIVDISSAETGVGFPVSASFGVTSSRWSSYNLKQLIIHADKALYVAKNNGRNRVEVFDGASAAPVDAAALQPGTFDRRRE